MVLLGPDRRRQDHDAAAGRGARAARSRHRSAIGGRDVTRVPPAARDVAFVFQQYSLYPHLSVYDNLAFPLRSPARRMPEDDIRKQGDGHRRDAAHREQAAAIAPTRLSGGEMQRVAIGRALVRRPSLYLMDEPLSSLDAKLRADLRLELKRIQIELGATFLYVTHDQIEAMTMATQIGVIESGRIVQIGAPREIYEAPNSVYVAARLGQPPINLLPRAAAPDLPAPARGGDDRRAHGASAGSSRRKARTRMARSSGSSISAIRTVCMPASSDTTSSRSPSPTRRCRSATTSASVLSIRCSSTPTAIASLRGRPDGVAARPVGPVHAQAADRRCRGARLAHADELTALDSAIGDGDHGHNMKRGFEAVLGSLDSLAAMDPPELLKALGMKLVTTVGGASGPLYGTLFMALGKAWPATSTRADLAAASSRRSPR